MSTPGSGTDHNQKQVGNESKENSSEVKNTVIPDECGDTLWDDVLAQQVNITINLKKKQIEIPTGDSGAREGEPGNDI